MRNAGLDELQAGIKIGRRNNNDLRYADDTTLMAESGEELKSFLMRVKEKSEKVSLKLSIKKIRSWHPVPSLHGKWEGGGVLEAVTDVLFLGSKITVDGDCSHEIRRRLPLGRKAMTNLNSVLKSKDITLPIKVDVVRTTAFPVVKYGCESGTRKKTDTE